MRKPIYPPSLFLKWRRAGPYRQVAMPHHPLSFVRASKEATTTRVVLCCEKQVALAAREKERRRKRRNN